MLIFEVIEETPVLRHVRVVDCYFELDKAVEEYWRVKALNQRAVNDSADLNSYWIEVRDIDELPSSLTDL